MNPSAEVAQAFFIGLSAGFAVSLFTALAVGHYLPPIYARVRALSRREGSP